jgi:shikimate kinase
MFDQLPASQLDEAEKRRLDSLWDKVEHIYKQAKSCQERSKDENAWAAVVRKILEAAADDYSAGALEVNSV